MSEINGEKLFSIVEKQGEVDDLSLDTNELKLDGLDNGELKLRISVKNRLSSLIESINTLGEIKDPELEKKLDESVANLFNLLKKFDYADSEAALNFISSIGNNPDFTYLKSEKDNQDMDKIEKQALLQIEEEKRNEELAKKIAELEAQRKAEIIEDKDGFLAKLGKMLDEGAKSIVDPSGKIRAHNEDIYGAMQNARNPYKAATSKR